MSAMGWNPLIDVADVLELGDRVAWHYVVERVTSAARRASDALRRRQLAADQANQPLPAEQVSCGPGFEPPTQTREN